LASPRKRVRHIFAFFHRTTQQPAGKRAPCAVGHCRSDATVPARREHEESHRKRHQDQPEASAATARERHNPDERAHTNGEHDEMCQ